MTQTARNRWSFAAFGLTVLCSVLLVISAMAATTHKPMPPLPMTPGPINAEIHEFPRSLDLTDDRLPAEPPYLQ
jgi:hypothetical protein